MRLVPSMPCAAVALALVAVPASGEITVVNGVRYECADGVCRVVDDAPAFAAGPAAEPFAATSGDSAARSGTEATVRPPRIAQGYLDADGLLAFLAGGDGAGAASFGAESALWVVLLLAFLGGIALNLTPCVLPMIPVNLLVIGRSARRGAFYGLGIALAYGTLGVLAAVGGLAFGAIQSSPWFNAAVALAFAALALALGGAWTVDFARFRRTDSGSFASRRLSDGFAFAMGALSAVLAGACVAPVLVGVLLVTADWYARGRQYALALPFVLGLGMALPWPFAGAGLRVLPRPGGWMKWVSRGFALAVLALAAHYGRLAWKGFAVSPGESADGAEGSVTPAEFAAALAAAPRPVFVDCWASWCKNCAAMDRTTFAEPRVRSALGRYAVIRLRAEDIGELRALPGFGEVRGLPAFAVFE